MSASLVGSEMCIRDRDRSGPWRGSDCSPPQLGVGRRPNFSQGVVQGCSCCLLYTSDAADDM
eukprot:14392385-Alexandrium_andersonii.AAC.1